jgi:hypothetical protein
MQRIARWLVVLLGLSLSLARAEAQLIARPANQFGAPPNQFGATPGYPYGTAGAGSQSAETDQIRKWYRDYLGREVGPEISAWTNLRVLARHENGSEVVWRRVRK